MNHAPHPASGSHCESLTVGEHRKKSICRLRFRSNHAAEALTIAAIGTARAHNPVRIAISLAGICRGMRVGMVSKLLYRFLELQSSVGRLQRGQRIFAHARSLENVAAH